MGIAFLETMSAQMPVVLGELEPICMHKTAMGTALKLRSFRPYQQFDLPSHSLIALRFSKQQRHFLTAPIQQHISSQNISNNLSLTACSSSTLAYVNFYMELLTDWRQHTYHYHWRNLSEPEKAIWLELALLEQGVQEKCLLQDVIVDCNWINSKQDLFCYMGEVLIGERCYVGRDLGGLEDCLMDLEFKPNFSITFKNSERLTELTKDNQDEQDFLNQFYNVLYETGNIRLHLN
ncbi:hypothetical protein VQ643_09810 [Pseudomonas sp. F1_0610]|uniref:barstar family protein n=1 Tax=Pseudomonas sp. F1_0610 TaxID=3114284 RepID=UPI0039C28C32